MFEILTTVMLSIMAIASPTLPYDYHSYTAQAKTNSLASSVLEVKIVPETQGSVIAQEENEGEKIAMDDFDTSEGLQLNLERRNGTDTLNQDPSEQEIAKMIKKAFPDEPLMVKIASCESDLEPKAKNKHSTAKGIFQILDGTWKHFNCKGDPFNAEDNISCGKKVLDGQGLSAWSESFSCWKNI